MFKSEEICNLFKDNGASPFCHLMQTSRLTFVREWESDVNKTLILYLVCEHLCPSQLDRFLSATVAVSQKK